MTYFKKNVYNKISDDLQNKIRRDREDGFVNPYRFDERKAVRRNLDHDKPNLWRPTFVRDIEKIMHLPAYNRYSDKTQVFSFYHNDDLTRRSLHVQLVSRIARNIGAVLGLNIDLIEAIALGHDIGHTPFGHAGERFLSDLYKAETGRYFNHNVHSVRVLDKIFLRNLTMQTLDGILCHNGEFELKEYRPKLNKTFEQLDSEIEACYISGQPAIKSLVPSTLEGCVVRVCDMIAYIGKDRQDAKAAKIIDDSVQFSNEVIGTQNAAIINNLVVDIIQNSYGKDYILLSEQAFDDLKTAKKENNTIIYKNPEINQLYDDIIKPMFEELYYKLLADLKSGDKDSLIYRHHINSVLSDYMYRNEKSYLNEEPNDIVVDYIASMTDDYFIDLHKYLFPNSKYKIEYHSYFE
ncbi:MAG: HD domain-containing protein [Ruminococcus sp.]|nr:HD domain-containing protein [Ruminococcus sp.]